MSSSPHRTPVGWPTCALTRYAFSDNPKRKAECPNPRLSADRREVFEFRGDLTLSVHGEVGQAPQSHLRAVVSLTGGAEGEGSIEGLGVRVLAEPSRESARVRDPGVGRSEPTGRGTGEMIAAITKIGYVEDG